MRNSPQKPLPDFSDTFLYKFLIACVAIPCAVLIVMFVGVWLLAFPIPILILLLLFWR